MFRIEKTNYGFLLTFESFMSKEEVQNWYNEASKHLENNNSEFFVFVDMRHLIPLLPDAQQIMEKGQKVFKQKGMLRSAVVVKDKITKMQFIRLAKQTGIYHYEIYIDASNDKNWKQTAENWLLHSIDPENETVAY